MAWILGRLGVLVTIAFRALLGAAGVDFEPPTDPDQEPFWGIASVSGEAVVSSFDQRLGWQFTVGASDLTVNALRVKSSANDERVMIHRVSDGAIMATADIGGNNLSFVAAGISPVTLSAGAAYTISSRRASGGTRNIWRNPSSITYYAGFTRTGGVFGTDHNLPTTTTTGVYSFVDFGFTE